MVESQPSKLLVAGSIPVSRSIFSMSYRIGVTMGSFRKCAEYAGALRSLGSNLPGRRQLRGIPSAP